MTEDIGPRITNLDRAPWPHETCGCRPPENALPPYWTCFKCDSTWTYLSGDIEGWAIGV